MARLLRPLATVYVPSSLVFSESARQRHPKDASLTLRAVHRDSPTVIRHNFLDHVQADPETGGDSATICRTEERCKECRA